MKKWFIALAALALLLIPSVAMADADGPQYCSACGECMEKVSVTPYERYHVILWECKSCGKTQKTYPNHTLGAATCVGCICTVCDYRSDVDMNEFNHVNPTIIGYTRVDSNEHSKVIYCDACDGREWIYEKHTFGKWTSTEDGKKHTGSCLCGEETTADHTGGNPTCQTSATCSVCKLSYYGSHNWGEWQPGTINTSLHYRICQNAGCSASESESHDGNSNCVTPATCSKCHASYTDTTKHAGPFTYLYNKYDESFHKRIETCTACGNKTGNQVETRHEESTPADCAHAAWCNVCNQAYGAPNPDNHVWGDWIYENENQHYRICAYNESHIQHADHRGGGATCIKEGTCTDCGASYKDPNKHEGESRTAYQNVSDTEHKVMVTCSSCWGVTSTYNESHVEFAPANCSARAMCGRCWIYYGAPDPNNHVGETTTTYVKTSETQHTAKIQYSDCGHTVDGASADHTETTAATCTTAAYCEVCESNYGDPDPNAHDLVQYDAKAPTCTEIGWDAYETCTRCDYSTYKEIAALGHDLVHHDAQAPNCTEVGWNAYDTCSRCALSTYTEIAAWGHWYAEWTPNANATHTASCKRSCSHQRTVGCAPFTFALLTGDERTEYTLCPVCGELGDGTRLALAEAAAAEAVTRKLPAGEAVVRMGALENGQTVMSVAFEYSGALTQPRGQVKITLPAGLLDGYALCLLAGDGTETALTLDVQEEEVSFVLDFTDAQCPVQVLRLMPVA